MSIARTQYLGPVVLPAGSIRAGLAAAIDAGGGPADQTFTLARILPDGSRNEQEHRPLASLDELCNLGEEGLTIQGGWRQDGEFHYLALYGGTPQASLHVSSPSAGLTQAMIDAFMRGADASTWSPPPASGEPPPDMPPELTEAATPSGDIEPGRILAPPTPPSIPVVPVRPGRSRVGRIAGSKALGHPPRRYCHRYELRAPATQRQGPGPPRWD